MHDETTAERPDRPTRDDEPAARVGASAAPRGRERPDRPTSALAALGWPRLLVSAWPWRAGVCLVGTVALAAAGWLVFGIPVIVVGALAAHGSLTLSGTAVCVVIELVLVVGL
ncbi:MAG: hypothetical protein FWF28_03935, partial [Micrococcales bacterium]|nr:hypothetical protein [Micrococcales bacterium]